MTPVVIHGWNRRIAGAAVLGHHSDHEMELQRCAQCGGLQLAVRPANTPTSPSQCGRCEDGVCATVSAAHPVPKRPGQSIFDALRNMGVREL
jgi:hypothetical protein